MITNKDKKTLIKIFNLVEKEKRIKKMEDMTIYDIKKRTKETAPYFFSKDTLKFFGQTMESFSVEKQPDGRYRISAPSGPNWDGHFLTERYFNPVNNELERE